ncbi:MAG: dockerin type I domain-containing protein [bacterium]
MCRLYYTLALLVLLAAGLCGQQQSGTAASGQAESTGKELQSIVGQPVAGLTGGLLGRSLLDNYVPGDADASRMINITDAVYLIVYIFNNGNEPRPYVAGDANCDGVVNIADATFLVSYIFGSELPPGLCY